MLQVRFGEIALTLHTATRGTGQIRRDCVVNPSHSNLWYRSDSESLRQLFTQQLVVPVKFGENAFAFNTAARGTRQIRREYFILSGEDEFTLNKATRDSGQIRRECVYPSHSNLRYRSDSASMHLPSGKLLVITWLD